MVRVFLAVALGSAVLCAEGHPAAAVRYDVLRAEIAALLRSYPQTPDGSLNPSVLRLAWHNAATYAAGADPAAGPCSAAIRFEPESGYYANKGLEQPVAALARLKEHGLNRDVSYSDLWTLAAYVAVEEMGGPRILFTPGRPDAVPGNYTPAPADRIPGWNLTADEVIGSFGRMTLSVRDMVALLGAHSVGHTRAENSGFPFLHWDNTALVFDNFFYRFLLDQSWVYEKSGDCGGAPCEFYANRSWIMLLTDWILRDDPRLRPVAEEYAADQELWHRDFAVAFKKLTELGMPKKAAPCPRLKAADSS
ncbi:hypothetical protein DIPPA_22160 [Diplonema papillatum]|nr:hypothetical protein DIPPA_22160 [Diplonema papillatum]